MHSSKLLRTVESFSLEEWKGFNRFILGQVGVKAEVTALYKYLYKYKDDLSSDRLSIDKAHKSLFPKVSRKSFQNVMSKLNRITEDYLRSAWLKNNPHENDLILLQAYKDRGLYRLFDLKADRLRKDIEEDPVKDIWHDLIQLKINHAQFFSDNPIKNKNGKELLERVQNHLQTLASHLSLYYEGAMNHFGEISNTDFRRSIESLKKLNVPIGDSELAICLNHLTQVTGEKNSNSYRYLYNQLTTRDHSLSKEICGIILPPILRFAQSEFKEGVTHTPRDLFSLHKFGIESGLFLTNNVITPAIFLNTVNVACAMDAFPWAQKFMQTHEAFLRPEFRNETVVISNAQFNFQRKKYAEVLKLIRNVTFASFGNTMRMRWLQLCSCFVEYKEDHFFMESTIRNYNLFFENNKKKMSQRVYLSSLNLSRILKSQLRNNTYENLKKELEKTNNVIFKTFLDNLSKGLRSHKNE